MYRTLLICFALSGAALAADPVLYATEDTPAPMTVRSVPVEVGERCAVEYDLDAGERMAILCHAPIDYDATGIAQVESGATTVDASLVAALIKPPSALVVISNSGKYRVRSRALVTVW